MDMHDDNCLELIERYKKQLVESTNIKSSPDEMAVIDSILFRFWQMGWLKEQETVKKVLADRQCEVSPHYYERKGFCPKCHQEVKLILNRNYCGFCGQAVKWNE